MDLKISEKKIQKFIYSYYSITAPGTLISNRKYSVVASLHEAEGPCSMRISLEGPNLNSTQYIELQPFESKFLEFFPEKILNADYKLIAEGLTGIIFKNESRLYSGTYFGPKIYIQTDKAIYKPEDTIRFRFVVLDEHTRPLYLDDPIHVEILVS